MSDPLAVPRDIILAAVDSARQALAGDFPGTSRPDAPLDEIASDLRGADGGFMLKIVIDQARHRLRRQMGRKGLSMAGREALDRACRCCDTIQPQVIADIGEVISAADLAAGAPDAGGGIQLAASTNTKLRAIEDVVGHPMYTGEHPRFAVEWAYDDGLHEGLFPMARRRDSHDTTEAWLLGLGIDPGQMVIARRITPSPVAAPWGVLLDSYKLAQRHRGDPILFPPDVSWILCMDHDRNATYAERDRTVLVE